MQANEYAVTAKPKPMIDPSRADADEGPDIVAVAADGSEPRVTPAHQHARGQLLGASHGLVTVETITGQWVVPAVHCVWIPPHHPHALRSHGPFMGWSVYVAERRCSDLPASAGTMATSGLLRECVARAVTWSDGDDGPARDHLTEIVLDEIRSLPKVPFGLPMPSDPRLVRVARALAENPADTRRLEEWAIVANTPVRTLTRRFPIETGFSFTEWRQRVRLMRALEMLADGEAVTRVALDLGYETVSAFIALFRRSFGVTPGRYFRRA